MPYRLSDYRGLITECLTVEAQRGRVNGKALN